MEERGAKQEDMDGAMVGRPMKRERKVEENWRERRRRRDGFNERELTSEDGKQKRARGRRGEGPKEDKGQHRLAATGGGVGVRSWRQGAWEGLVMEEQERAGERAGIEVKGGHMEKRSTTDGHGSMRKET
eukprot:5792785-Pleurochrysis_carterae.AAC.1